jgi:hypothetical protein
MSMNSRISEKSMISSIFASIWFAFLSNREALWACLRHPFSAPLGAPVPFS